MADVGAPEPSAIQWVVDTLGALVLMAIGGIVKAIRSDQRDLREDHDALVQRLPETYARRDDVVRALDDMRAQQARIEHKLDRLVERS